MDVYCTHTRMLEKMTSEEYQLLFDLMCKTLLYELRDSTSVDKVIFNPPATIICWGDGTKSVVKCQNGEPYDPEKGFVMAYLKKLLGNDNTFNKEITKWVKYEEPKVKKTKATFIPYDKPLTNSQIRKMDGERLWLFALDGNMTEMENCHTSGWHTVDVNRGRMYDDNSDWFEIDDNNTPYGFHAYLEPTRGCFS